MAADEVASNGAVQADDAAADLVSSTAQAQAQSISAGIISLQSPTSTPPAHQFSADEIALYDRQIRLWGVQAQEKSVDRITSSN